MKITRSAEIEVGASPIDQFDQQRVELRPDSLSGGDFLEQRQSVFGEHNFLLFQLICLPDRRLLQQSGVLTPRFLYRGRWGTIVQGSRDI